MNIPSLKQLLKKFSFKRRGEFRAIGEKADHDWKYILITFFFFAGLSVGAGLYLFIQISNGNIFKVEAQLLGAQKVINQKDLDRTITFFEERKTKSAELQNMPSTVGDPSL